MVSVRVELLAASLELVSAGKLERKSLVCRMGQKSLARTSDGE